jgi:hypothetical protein
MNIVTQFLSFDKLMGQGLVKIVYFVGLIGLALGCVSWIFLGIAGMGVFGFGGFLTALIGAIIGFVVGVCFLRFGCEIYLVIFRIGEDIRAMRGGGGTLPPKV